MTGRSRAEGGKEEEEEEHEVRRVEKKVMNAILRGSPIESTPSGDVADAAEEMEKVGRGAFSACESMLGLSLFGSNVALSCVFRQSPMARCCMHKAHSGDFSARTHFRVTIGFQVTSILVLSLRGYSQPH